jgi:hypothetical protein
MNGTFSQWQPAYAARGIPTFPVIAKDKKPAVKNYLKVGLAGSRELSTRFGDRDALGFALGFTSKITVLDVDSNDERILSDALSRHGSTPVIVRSGGGNYQAWYRHDGERRRIRPRRDVPVDILGNGYVVAPPSQGAKGRYTFIQGKLDDVDRLPVMAGLDGLKAKEASDGAIRFGERNDRLFEHCMRHAPHCDAFDQLIDVAATFNAECLPPQSDAEVMKTAKSAWNYQQKGDNWFGSRGMVAIPRDMLRHLDPYETYVYLTLRRAHAGLRETFAIAVNSFSKELGWSKRRLISVRDGLIEKGVIERTHRGGSRKGDAAAYRLLPWDRVSK